MKDTIATTREDTTVRARAHTTLTISAKEGVQSFILESWLTLAGQDPCAELEPTPMRLVDFLDERWALPGI